MLSPPPKLEINEFPHHKCLSQADGGQHADSNSQDIEVSSAEIQLLIFCSCQTKAKSEDRKNQGEKPSQNKKDCPQWKSFLVSFITEVEKTRYVEKKFNEVIQYQENKPEMGQIQKIGSSNMEEIKSNVDNLAKDILFFSFLEVQFWESMKPVCQL